MRSNLGCLRGSGAGAAGLAPDGRGQKDWAMVERIAVYVTFDGHGYVGRAPEFPQPVVALSLSGIRRRAEELLSPDEVIVTLSLDKAARREHDQRRRSGQPGVWPR